MEIVNLNSTIEHKLETVSEVTIELVPNVIEERFSPHVGLYLTDSEKEFYVPLTYEEFKDFINTGNKILENYTVEHAKRNYKW